MKKKKIIINEYELVLFVVNNYIEYKSNSDRNKTLSVEEYLNKITSYLKDINILKKSNMRKTQLTIKIYFISSTYGTDKSM